MKKQLHVLLLLASTVVFGQLTPKEFDYFVQFNGSQFSKKVSLDEIINHEAIKKISKTTLDFNVKDYTSLIRMDKNTIIHGNFSSDSIPFYQITIPIISSEEVKALVSNKIAENEQKGSDSIVAKIVDYESYSVYDDPNSEVSIAWNNKYLVFITFIKPISMSNSYSNLYNIPETVYDEEIVEVDEAVEEVESTEEYNGEESTEEVVMESNETEEQTVEWAVEEAPSENYDYNYNYEEENKDYLEEIEQEKLKRKEMQSEHIEFLFKNGFVVPTFDKINAKADVSAWINYQSSFNSLKTFTSALGYIFGQKTNIPSRELKNYIQGMNFDFYFENDNARVEQSIEYSNSLANIMSKVVDRKINKNIFGYFPNEKPLAYMTYHINSKEILNNFPAISEQLYSNIPFLEQEDITIITDLIATFLDEEAISTLFDGDLSMFLHDLKNYESTYTAYEYDENYEEIEVEKTINKTTPTFTVLFTSTHKTMGDKLLDLAVRKGGFTKKGDYYEVRGSSEMGNIKVVKKGDVIIITNRTDFSTKPVSTDFSKELKKELKTNTVVGSVNLKDLILKTIQNEALGKDSTKMLKVSEQFEEIRFKSSKKIENNKQHSEMSLHASKNDKNIILQTLDLVTFLSTK